MKRLLLAGETFAYVEAAASGRSIGLSSRYANGATHFLAAMEGTSFAIEQMPSERCEADFPKSAEALECYSAVILSDVSALTLLFTPEIATGACVRQSPEAPVRLCRERRQLDDGGWLYESYQRMEGRAHYHETPVEDCLPVIWLPSSDALEAPEGLLPTVVRSQPIVAAAPSLWPPVLGLNKVIVRTTDDVTLIADAEYCGHRLPLLAVREFGAGRTLAFMTDIGPHWMSQQFLASGWNGDLMRGMMGWLCRKS